MNKYSLGFVIASICLLASHLVLGFLGYVNIIAVIITPAVITLTSIFIHFLFAYCINKNDFSVIAGYDVKKNDDAQVKKQLNAIGLLNSALALFINVLFFAAYAFAAKGQEGGRSFLPSIILLGVYIVALAVIVLSVNVKIKTR